VIPVAIGVGAAGLVAVDPGLGVYLLGLGATRFGYGLGWSIVSVGTQ
jgi:hypothetical protein